MRSESFSFAKNALLCSFRPLSISCLRFDWWSVFGSWDQIWRYALLLLEQRCGLSLIFSELRCSLITQLVVNFYLIACHLDILLNNAHFLLLFGPLETEVVLILSSIDAFRDL